MLTSELPDAVGANLIKKHSENTPGQPSFIKSVRPGYSQNLRLKRHKRGFSILSDWRALVSQTEQDTNSSLES